MVDINPIYLALHLANFLVLMIALHVIIFKPLRSLMEERDLGVSSAFGEARSAQERTQQMLGQYHAALAEAKTKSAAVYNALYQQGLDEQRDLIAAERSRAGEMLDRARADIAAAAETARAELRREAERIAREITTSVLGR